MWIPSVCEKVEHLFRSVSPDAFGNNRVFLRPPIPNPSLVKQTIQETLCFRVVFRSGAFAHIAKSLHFSSNKSDLDSVAQFSAQQYCVIADACPPTCSMKCAQIAGGVVSWAGCASKTVFECGEQSERDRPHSGRVHRRPPAHCNRHATYFIQRNKTTFQKRDLTSISIKMLHSS